MPWKGTGSLENYLRGSGIGFHRFKDQVIFEEDEILKNDGKPYTVFTPYKRKWLERFQDWAPKALREVGDGRFIQSTGFFPQMEALGFKFPQPFGCFPMIFPD